MDVAKKDKCDEDILNQLDAMKQKIENDKKNDLYKFKDEISEVLLSEIVVRYYNQKGRIEAYINHDPEVSQAVNLLHDIKKYNDILKK